MKIEIVTDKSFDPENTTIAVNGVPYKKVKGLKLLISGNNNGSIAIEHESGYLEAYKSEKAKEE